MGQENLREKPEGDQFHLLIEGKIQGPFSTKEIQEKLKEKEILFTDLISTDQGQVWEKIYDLDEFDRRSLEQVLPHLPEGEVFYHSKRSTDKALQTEDQAHMQVIADLAYISGHKARPRPSSQVEEETEKKPEKESGRPQENKGPNSFSMVASIVALLVIGFFAYAQFSSSKKKSNKSKVVKKEAVNRLSKRKPASKIKRSTTSKRKIAKRIKRAPARAKGTTSFRNSKSFREAKSKKIMDDNPILQEEDTTYEMNDMPDMYDNGENPIVLDPVRAELSKDTIDPEEKELDRTPSSINDHFREDGSELEVQSVEPFDAELEY